jgi:hypothetical protein
MPTGAFLSPFTPDSNTPHTTLPLSDDTEDKAMDWLSAVTVSLGIDK